VAGAELGLQPLDLLFQVVDLLSEVVVRVVGLCKGGGRRNQQRCAEKGAEGGAEWGDGRLEDSDVWCPFPPRSRRRVGREKDTGRAANQGFTGPRRDAPVESSPNADVLSGKGVAAGVLRRGVP